MLHVCMLLPVYMYDIYIYIYIYVCVCAYVCSYLYMHIQGCSATYVRTPLMGKSVSKQIVSQPINDSELDASILRQMTG